MNNPNVLVVEDDVNSLRLYKKIFLKRGYTVHAVTNIVDARRLLSEHTFSVIICDMQIGEARGVDFIRDEHDHLATVGTQVIVVSGHEHFRSVCEELGVEFYISKPISTHELGSIVDRLMKMYQANQPSVSTSSDGDDNDSAATNTHNNTQTNQTNISRTNIQNLAGAYGV